MRRLAIIAVLGVALLPLNSRAEAYRDELGIPSYRLLASMLTEYRGTGPLDRDQRSAEVVAPLVRALDAKHGTQIERALRKALQAGDRDGALIATTALVLLDAQDLLEGIKRDDYTGWSDAKIRAKKAVLDYGLVASVLHGISPDLDRRAVSDFGQLVLELHDADMETPPEQAEGRRAAVVSDLIALRGAALKKRPNGWKPGDG